MDFFDIFFVESTHPKDYNENEFELNKYECVFNTT